MYGYDDWGATTWYTDSASGGVGIPWGNNVPKFSALPSDKITQINGGRGYVW